MLSLCGDDNDWVASELNDVIFMHATLLKAPEPPGIIIGGPDLGFCYGSEWNMLWSQMEYIAYLKANTFSIS